MINRKSEHMKVLFVTLLVAGVFAGSSYAATSRLLHARPGDTVIAGKVACVVKRSVVTYGLYPHTKVTATVTRNGIALAVGQRVRFVCLTSGVCVKP